MYVILKCSYWLVLYPEAVSPNMDFWNKINWIELNIDEYNDIQRPKGWGILHLQSPEFLITAYNINHFTQCTEVHYLSFCYHILFQWKIAINYCIKIIHFEGNVIFSSMCRKNEILLISWFIPTIKILIYGVVCISSCKVKADEWTLLKF
jgi:hypothetical protein